MQNQRKIDSLLQIYVEAGHEALEQGHFKSAGKFFLAALRETKNLNESPLWAGVLFQSLAVFYKRQGRYVKAARFYNRALALFEETHETEKVAYILLQLADLYARQEKHAIAKRLYRKSLAIYNKTPQTYQPEITAVSQRLANLSFIERKGGQYWQQSAN